MKSYIADLQKTYENLTMNLGKILQDFENRAPESFESLARLRYIEPPRCNCRDGESISLRQGLAHTGCSGVCWGTNSGVARICCE